MMMKTTATRMMMSKFLYFQFFSHCTCLKTTTGLQDYNTYNCHEFQSRAQIIQLFILFIHFFPLPPICSDDEDDDSDDNDVKPQKNIGKELKKVRLV